MAIIYGKPESEIELLNRAPSSVKKIDDVDSKHYELKNRIAKDRKDFFNDIPNVITKEEKKLENIKYNEWVTEQKFDEKLKQLENEKAKGGFAAFSAPVKSFFVKNYSKRKEINKIKDQEYRQQSYIKEWKENPDRIFKTIQHKTISEFNHISKVKKDPFHPGAKGEVYVLERLKKLSNDFHVLCGLNIGLEYPVTYRKKRRSLRSAQMDFVVISKRGVVLIEVKNWSDGYANLRHRMAPHEQVDRAGLVLWIALKSSWYSPKNPPVTKVLLSIKGNLDYNPRYKYVLVSNLNKINHFLENGQEKFSSKEVQRLVDRIKGAASY